MSLYDGRPDKRKGLMGLNNKKNDSLFGQSIPEKSFNSRIVDIASARADGNYAKAYDLSDSLLKDVGMYGRDGNSSIVWAKIMTMLEMQYKDSIIKKYNQAYSNILNYGSQESYRASQYPGSYEEYAKAAALDEVTGLYSKTRYGGYMHTIVLRVLKKHFEEEKAKKEGTAYVKKMPADSGLPQDMTAEQRKKKLEVAKKNVREALLNENR